MDLAVLIIFRLVGRNKNAPIFLTKLGHWFTNEIWDTLLNTRQIL